MKEQFKLLLKDFKKLKLLLKDFKKNNIIKEQLKLLFKDFKKNNLIKIIFIKRTTMLLKEQFN